MKKTFLLLSLILSTCICFAFADQDRSKNPFSLESSLPNQQVPPNSNRIVDKDLNVSPQLEPKKQKNTFITLGLAYLFPGLGHLYLGEMREARQLAGSSLAGLGTVAFGATRNGTTARDLIQSGITVMSTTWSYGIYAAYRDVRKSRIDSKYSYKMPQDSFAELTLASFQPSIMKKPEVWGGILGALALGTAISYFTFPEEANISCSTSSRTRPIFAFPTGIAEESLFRGYLQSQISELSNPTVGIIGSSLIFGAAHIPNAQLISKEHRWRYYTFSIPFITAFGSYFGWLTLKNQSLKESVAVHAWYDFVLFLASSLAVQSAIKVTPRFQVSFSF